MSWISNTYQPNGAGLWQQNGLEPETALGGPLAGAAAGGYGAADGYQPPWWGGNNAGGVAGQANNTNSMLGQIVSLLQQLVGSIGGSLGGASTGTPPMMPLQQPYGPGFGQQHYDEGDGQQPGTATFSNATLSSTGDPHLALTGTEQNANGSTTQINSHYDDMNSQRDLLSTRDFGAALRVSTTATQPNANGVTYNATATASMNHGRDRVTMGQGGSVSVVSNGTTIALGAGGSVTLSGGEVVSENANGAVSIAEQNARGEALTTTFSYNGSGVDINANASGSVTLGGSLVRHATGVGG
jgi:hypothetical protein